MTECQESMNGKLFIMQGIFHNMACGTQINKANPTTQVLPASPMLANSFLSAHIFELGIKIMWELSYSQIFGETEINKYGHHINKIYPDLNPCFSDFISEKYRAEVKYFHNSLEEYLNSYQCAHIPKSEKNSILSCKYYSLIENLIENSKIVTQGKYRFQVGDKVNIVTGIMPDIFKNGETGCFRQPSPFLIEIIEYIKTQLQ